MRAINVGASLTAVPLLLVLASCEKASPTPPSPTVTSITITSSTDFLKVKESVTFVATAAHSDGTSAPVTEWRSDMPAVAAVDGVTGKVTGVSTGAATIVASHDGAIGTKLVKVLPDFGGTWKGEYRVTSCSATGFAASVCGYTAQMVGQLEFGFVQDREQVKGLMNFGYFLSGMLHPVGPVLVSGTIDTSGHLKLTGSHTNSRGYNFILRADESDLYIPADRLLGTFVVDMTVPSSRGTSYVTFGHTIWGEGLTKVD